MRRKVLIVDDNEINRQILSKILSRDYDVIEAANGKDAIIILMKTYETISAVLLDIVMPGMNGFEVLEIMQNDNNLSKLPVIVTTANNEDDAEVKALSIGAIDYIVKPYNPAVIIHRLRNTIKLRETAAIVNEVEKDATTGIYNKVFFCKATAARIRSNPDMKYDIICCDIERFKMINELFGERIGDMLLHHVAEIFTEAGAPDNICGRIGADTFACLTRHIDSYDSIDFDNIIRKVNRFPISINIELSYGIYVIEDTSILVSTMCDRALTACNSIKGKYGVYYAYYDSAFRQKLLAEQFILDSMKKGLSERQFVVYYQPKNSFSTDEVIGAEALVRWIHPTKGFMSPGEFIPLFERNGFITDLDIYVWNTACHDMSEWIKAGNKPVPISINVSRADIYNPDLCNILTGLINKYHLETKYLHLEITESAYTEDSKQLINAVSKLKELGFVIEMDDFGTGYSSLNMLSDLPINIVKLDMIFIREIANDRKKSILRTIIFLAKQLGLSVVAEGVETPEQVEILKKMGCDYAQGYFYSKPLPLKDFEEYLFNSVKL